MKQGRGRGLCPSVEGGCVELIFSGGGAWKSPPRRRHVGEGLQEIGYLGVPYAPAKGPGPGRGFYTFSFGEKRCELFGKDFRRL